MRRIDELQEEIDDLRDDVAELRYMLRKIYDEFDERVDNNIKNKIYVRTVENLNNYRKGKELEKPLNAIKEILR